LSTTLYNSLQKAGVPYDEREVIKSIIVIRKSSNLKLLEKHKNYMYNALGTIIIKNVNNFFNMVKELPKELVIHTKDDIVIECYIILTRCINKFDITRPDFFFYYNKSLSHGLYRFKNKNYKEKNFTVNYDDVSAYEQKTFTKQDFNPLLLNENFTDLELHLIDSKTNGTSVDTFIKQANITRVIYFNTLKSIKDKIDKHYR
jgi:hypothetical protein